MLEANVAPHLRHDSPSRIVVIGVAFAALLIKLIIAFQTLGTNDVVSFSLFAKSLSEHGLEATYRHNTFFNHPPLVAYYLIAIWKVGQYLSGSPSAIFFPFFLRLPGCLADFVVVLVLLLSANGEPRLKLPTWSLVLLALSPLSIMVSGYHGNTDSVMVMFLVLSAYFCSREQPILCGLFFAVSVQVKIIPLLFLPVYLAFWMRRSRLPRFCAPVIVTNLAFWLTPLLSFPQPFFRNVFSYNSFWGIWGFTYLLRLTGITEFNRVTFLNFGTTEKIIVVASKMIIVLGVLGLAWRRRAVPNREIWVSIACGWIIFFALAPGVAIQYLVWLTPFVLILSPQFFLGLTITSSIFAFVFYNTISHGLPWYLGISTNTLNRIWTPWGLLPWATILVMLTLSWRKSYLFEPALGEDIPTSPPSL